MYALIDIFEQVRDFMEKGGTCPTRDILCYLGIMGFGFGACYLF